MPAPESHPLEELPDQWIEYPADAVLPHGLRFKVSDGVIVEVESSAKELAGLGGSHYIPGDVDATDITPALWRAIDLEMIKPDGSVADLRVLRPLWWLQQTQAQPGTTIDLSLAEIGLSGSARVLNVMPCE